MFEAHLKPLILWERKFLLQQWSQKRARESKWHHHPQSAPDFPYCKLLETDPFIVRCSLPSYVNGEKNSEALHRQDLQSNPLLLTSKWFSQNKAAKNQQRRLMKKCCPISTPCRFLYPRTRTLRNNKCLECTGCAGTDKCFRPFAFEQPSWPRQKDSSCLAYSICSKARDLRSFWNKTAL